MPLTPAERGRLGGQRTHALHGPTHMEATLRQGNRVTTERYYGGDVRAYMQALSARSHAGGAERDPRLGCLVKRA